MGKEAATGKRLTWAGVILLIICCPISSQAQWTIDFETGLAINGYNNVRIPGSTGTKISLSEELESKPAWFGRLRIVRDFGNNHHLSLLIAPLRLKSEGKFNRAVYFSGAEFPANTPLEALYRFDSYRLTYRYDLHRGGKLIVGIGITAKIRDAAISLTGDGKKTEITNTGFVPLLNFKLNWQFNRRMGLILDGDGLAASQGRAEDFLLGLYSNLGKKFQLKAGYRLLEGGADNDEVYNFTLVNYFVAGLVCKL
jgi:hypothetical protein